MRSGYVLVVDKGGPKFKEDDPNANFMGQYARRGLMLYSSAGAPAPNPDFESKGTTPLPAVGSVRPEADLFTALREPLGLKLERREVHVQFVVIDHVERVPTEN